MYIRFKTMLSCTGTAIFISILLISNVANTTVYAQNYTSYVQFLSIGRGNIGAVAWNPNGNMIAVGGNQGVWIYTKSLNDLLHIPELPGVEQLGWSPDGKLLAIYNRVRSPYTDTTGQII